MLSYDLVSIENYKELIDDDGNPLPLTEGFIWLMLAIGIDKITKKNAHDVYLRIHLAEAVNDCSFLFSKDEEGNNIQRPISFDDVKRHVGLKTNASKKSVSEFYSGLLNKIKNSCQ